MNSWGGGRLISFDTTESRSLFLSLARRVVRVSYLWFVAVIKSGGRGKEAGGLFEAGRAFRLGEVLGQGL